MRDMIKAVKRVCLVQAYMQYGKVAQCNLKKYVLCERPPTVLPQQTIIYSFTLLLLYLSGAELNTHNLSGNMPSTIRL